MVGIVDPAGSTTIRLPTSVGVSVADPVREDAPRRNLESLLPPASQGLLRDSEVETDLGDRRSLGLQTRTGSTASRFQVGDV